jgi:DNA-binding NtrC family response regulator
LSENQGARLLVVEDEANLRLVIQKELQRLGYRVQSASDGEAALRKLEEGNVDVLLSDINMPRMDGMELLRRVHERPNPPEVIMLTGHATVETAIEAMKLGAYDYVLKPFDVPKLKSLVSSALEASRAMKKVVSYQPLLESEDYDIGIVGRTEPMQNVFKLIGQLAMSDATALITGESGTGKELIARAIYHHSKRSEKAFLAINCAAIPENLLESELFGHEKGAFTGAIAQRVGRFELANRGTVFLDEIGEIPLELQPKLLRVLQEREFERLGSTRTLRTDARLIAATNRDLATMVEEQKFRSDLYYRLNVFPVRVPPLRERREDIPLLVRHFVQQFSRRMNRSVETIPSDTMNTLIRYDWPGNIRELQNVIERAVILSTGPVLKVPMDHLKTRVSPADVSNGGSASEDAGKMRGMLEDAERKQILAALKQAKWVVAGPKGAAALVGMKRSTLQAHMQRLGIRVSRTVG